MSKAKKKKSTASRTEIRITGFGGQGVVLSGHILGRACAIEAGQHSTMIQSFGPEARGSACSSTLVVSDSEVLYPYIHRPDIFVVMSSEGYEKYPPPASPSPWVGPLCRTSSWLALLPE